jgi:hypothetical protein
VLFFRVFALLIRDAAGGFARGLAGGLALAAAARFRRLAKVARRDGFDSAQLRHLVYESFM